MTLDKYELVTINIEGCERMVFRKLDALITCAIRLYEKMESHPQEIYANGKLIWSKRLDEFTNESLRALQKELCEAEDKRIYYYCTDSKDVVVSSAEYGPPCLYCKPITAMQKDYIRKAKSQLDDLIAVLLANKGEE